MLSGLCLRGAGAGHAAERAALLRWLLDRPNAGAESARLELQAVNAALETPLHCALRSGSAEVLEVRARGSLGRTRSLNH